MIKIIFPKPEPGPFQSIIEEIEKLQREMSEACGIPKEILYGKQTHTATEVLLLHEQETTLQHRIS